MPTSPSRTDRYRHLEALLAAVVVLLKLHVLWDSWSKVQGYDWGGFIEMLNVAHWFEPLPPPMMLWSSYHPPLSFLIGRAIYTIYPHEVEASQIESTLSILIAFFAFRYVLRRTGWLWTLPGLWMLYGVMSLPLVVNLGVESTYDSVALAWFMLVFASSVSLFWYEFAQTWWKDNGVARRIVVLGLLLAACLLNKYSGLLAFALPFLIIVVRRGIKATFRESSGPIVAAIIGLVVVIPFFYEHNYKVEGRWTPASMDFRRSHDLVVKRAERDAARGAFFANMVRIPSKMPIDPQEPVMDSFIHSTWLHVWVRDSWLGKEPEPALTISRAYYQVFRVLTLAGSALFFLRCRRISRIWRQLGWLFLGILVCHAVFALSFGWSYPIWDWRIFKTKYYTPIVLWIPYAIAVCFADLWYLARQATWLRWFEDASFCALVAFIMINHLLPIY
jgi:hypothetical protein